MVAPHARQPTYVHVRPSPEIYAIKQKCCFSCVRGRLRGNVSTHLAHTQEDADACACPCAYTCRARPDVSLTSGIWPRGPAPSPSASPRRRAPAAGRLAQDETLQSSVSGQGTGRQANMMASNYHSCSVITEARTLTVTCCRALDVGAARNTRPPGLPRRPPSQRFRPPREHPPLDIGFMRLRFHRDSENGCLWQLGGKQKCPVVFE